MRLLRLDSYLIVAAALVLLGGCRPATYDIETATTPLIVGADTVYVVEHTAEAPGPTYLNLHDDENTAVSAALAVIGEHGGRLLELRHSDERRVRFVMDGVEYSIDPNRIFSSAGLDSTIVSNGSVSDAARREAASFAERILEIVGIDTLEALVTVHNNGPGEYSARSYAAGGPYAPDARFVHITSAIDEDDFFFVTTEWLYVELRDGGYNVVMQHPGTVTDDGSLSVLAADRRIPYANVEAEHGHFELQEEMLTFLRKVLARAGAPSEPMAGYLGRSMQFTNRSTASYASPKAGRERPSGRRSSSSSYAEAE